MRSETILQMLPKSSSFPEGGPGIVRAQGRDVPSPRNDRDGRMSGAAMSRVRAPPRRSGRLCERQELLDSLDEGQQSSVTLIIAPAGFGKTTLIAQWCERLAAAHQTVAYYSAAEQDRDPTMVLAMIASALAEAGIETGASSAFRDGTVRDDISLDDILLDLELAGQPTTLIIDDFERVNDLAVGEIVTRLIAAAPASLHLVIASRALPAMPLSVLELSGKLRLIDAYQLRLRREELAWMLELDPDTAEIREIASRTQGWPVTAELYRLWRLRHRDDERRTSFGGHVAELHNYLAEELFSSLPGEHHALLVDIADRDEVSADLVDAMREREDSGRLLAAIAKSISSLMWTGHDHGRTIYRLHPLLLEHLRQTLELDVVRRRTLAVNAARWFFAGQQYPEAVRTAIQSRDEATIGQVIQALRPMHILISDGATKLRMILRELSDDLIALHPRLQVMGAIAHFKAGFFGETMAMVARIRAATDDFTADPDGRPDWLAIEGHLAMLIALCQTSRCGKEVDVLHDLVRHSATDDPIIWGACEIITILVQQVHGHFNAAEAAIQRARGIYNTVELSRYSHTQILGQEVLLLGARGRLRRAIEIIGGYQKHPAFQVPDDISTPTLLRLIFAAVRYEQEFSDSAIEALRGSFAEHSRTESWFDQYAIAYSVLVMRLAAHEGLDAALAMIAEARERAQRTGIEALPDFLTMLEIEHRARSQDIVGARQLADALDLRACAYGTDPLAARRGWRERDAALQAYICLCLSEQDHDEAIAAAQALTRAGQTGGRLRAEIKGLVLAAVGLARAGRSDDAVAELLKAVLRAYPERFVAPFAEEGAALLPLIDHIIALPGSDAFARRHGEEVRRAIQGAMGGVRRDRLNAREREIIDHLAEGLSNKVIARRMGITDHTVKFHLKKIFAKLEVSSRRAAVAKVQSGDLPA
jgi:LuxR family maltose regulon positive regulatory protein